MYPCPTTEGVAETIPLTLLTLRAHCWPSRAEELATEDLELRARGIWRDLSRPHLVTVLRQGLWEGSWAVWRKTADEMFFTQGDIPEPAIEVGPA
jgi:hypothetical protein